MLTSRSALTVVLLVSVFLAGCTVQSRHKTRSFLSEEELKKVNEEYFGPEEEEEKQELEIEPFLADFEGSAVRVNNLEILASDIRQLYEYLASTSNEDPAILKQRAAMEWIRTYAVMSQWPDMIHVAAERLEDIRLKVDQGADFEGLILENSQEEDVEFRKGDLGTFGRGEKSWLVEMHAFQDPLNRLSQAFPTIIGWHLLEPLERNMDDPDNPKVHARNLLLIHGLDPANKQLIRDNYVRWTNTADIEFYAEELSEIFPGYAKPEPEEPEG